jgi:peptidoglycan hydrolase CwlO-like protein
LAYKARDLEATIENQREKLTAARQSVEQMKKQLAQRTEETKKILAEAEEIIATLSGSKHALKLDN